MSRNLAKDKAMCEAATGGRWAVEDNQFVMIQIEGRGYVLANCDYVEDARFIAESRQALPYWIAKYEEMKSSLDSVQEFFDNLCVRSNEVTERLQARISELEAQVESYQRPMTVPREKRSFEPDIVDLEELEDLLLCQMSHERGKQA